MNIIEAGTGLNIEAKLFRERNSINIVYSFIEPPHSLCVNKREIILSQIQACERLFSHIKEETELKTINKEISSLKTSLDFCQNNRV
jgi:hypothetical protein